MRSENGGRLSGRLRRKPLIVCFPALNDIKARLFVGFVDGFEVVKPRKRIKSKEL